jgi:hypothetical protein
LRAGRRGTRDVSRGVALSSTDKRAETKRYIDSEILRRRLDTAEGMPSRRGEGSDV